MDPTEKQAILNDVGIVSANLHDDTAFFEHKILQTENVIQSLQAGVEELRQRQEGIYAEEEGDEAVAAMKSIGDSLTHLGSVLAHMEQKRALLELALRNTTTAGEELFHFANGVASLD